MMMYSIDTQAREHPSCTKPKCVAEGMLKAKHKHKPAKHNAENSRKENNIVCHEEIITMIKL